MARICGKCGGECRKGAFGIEVFDIGFGKPVCSQCWEKSGMEPEDWDDGDEESHNAPAPSFGKTPTFIPKTDCAKCGRHIPPNECGYGEEDGPFCASCFAKDEYGHFPADGPAPKVPASPHDSNGIPALKPDANRPKAPREMGSVVARISGRNFFAVLDVSNPEVPTCLVYEDLRDSGGELCHRLRFIGFERYTKDYPNPSEGLMLSTLNKVVGGFYDE